MKYKRLLLILVLLALLIPNQLYGEEAEKKAYLILTNRITLRDIKSMDNVQAVIKSGGLGLMNTRGISSYTGIESFLTINASGKSHGNYNIIEFEQLENTAKIKNMSLGKIVDLNKDNNYKPSIGVIGKNLQDQGLETAVYGNSNLLGEIGSPAALIPMNSEGLVDYGNIEDIVVEDEKYPFKIRTDYGKLLKEVKNSPADFIVIDTGDLERIYKYREKLSEVEYKNIREGILKDIDIFIGNFLTEIDLNNSLMIITSPNEGDKNIDNSRLSPLILLKENRNKGSIISSTTKRKNIVSNIDIGPTVMNFLQVPQDNMSGKPIRQLESLNTLDGIIQENNQINTTSRVRYKTLFYYSKISILALLIPMISILARIKLSKKTKEIVSCLLALLLIMPSVFILVSHFNLKNIKSYIFSLVGLIFLFAIIIWNTRKQRNQAIYISGFTVILIFLDLLLKGKISMYSVLSHDPIIGARYYGIGNEMTGLLLGSTAIFGKHFLRKNDNLLAPGMVFIISLILVASPNLGANVGGTLTFIGVLSMYILESLELKLNYRKMIVIIILIIIFISFLGYIDIKINESTTHLGNTIMLVKNNGINYLTSIVLRKILMNVKLIGSSFWTYLLLIHMFSHCIIFHNVKKINENSSKTIVAGVGGAIIGFLLNDSGVLLAAICMNMITLELYLEDR